MSYPPPPPPPRRPPSKYLALWISLPVIALVACCGGIGAVIGGDDEAEGKPQPFASIAGVPGSSGSAPDAVRTPADTPTSASATAATTTSPSPAGATATSPPVAGTTAPTTRPPTTRTTPPTTRTTTAPPSSVFYANCAAVRAAGKAPLYRGQPGYRPPLDRDNDGVACE